MSYLDHINTKQCPCFARHAQYDDDTSDIHEPSSMHLKKGSLQNHALPQMPRMHCLAALVAC
jgi:hypothetical protein